MEIIKYIVSSDYPVWIRTSGYFYPLLQVIHVIGFSIAAGSLIVGNIRILGVAPELPIREFSRHIYHWVSIGIFLFLVSGINMAIGFLNVFAVNPIMWIKMIMLCGAVLINVRLYRWQFGAEEHAAQVGPKEKTLAVLSVAILLAIITMGKLLAYIGGKD